MSNGADLAEAIETIGLVDHHVHGALKVDLSVDSFEATMTESDRTRRPGTTNFDSQVGMAMRRWCAPVLGLDAFASPADYLGLRRELGFVEVNERLLRAAGLSAMLIDTGFASEELYDVKEMASVVQAPSFEIVRLECVAEDVARSGRTAEDFANSFRDLLGERLSKRAVGTKSIAAYRYGLDFPHERPDEKTVAISAGRWFSDIERTDVIRVDDPILLSFLLWSGVDAGLPVQIHVGYGDSDLDLIRSNPVKMTDFLRAVEPIGTPIVLLHCYPYQREAGYLAQVFPNVFFDIGEGLHYSGTQSRQLIAESFELGPFYKQMYSSDGWGLAEFHYLGARLWRTGIASVFSQWVDEGHWSRADAIRISTMVGRDNAIKLYQLDITE